MRINRLKKKKSTNHLIFINATDRCGGQWSYIIMPTEKQGFRINNYASIFQKELFSFLGVCKAVDRPEINTLIITDSLSSSQRNTTTGFVSTVRHRIGRFFS